MARVKQTLYEYAVVYNPTKKKDGKAEVIDSGTMLGDDPKLISMTLLRKIDKKYDERLADIDILVRDF